MSRRILQERRVRAIAAVHALIGAMLVVFTIVSLAIFLSRSHNPRDMGALAVSLIGGMVVIGGAIFVGVSWLLWMYRPVARWTTGALFAYALSLSAYLFLKYTVDGLGTNRGAWSRGEGSAFPQFVGAGLIEALVIAWSAVVLFTLFRPDSRDVFSAEYRESIRGDCAVSIRFYSSPYFVAGLVVWLVIGCVMAVLMSS
jgi:hypothetical protein